MMFDGCEGDLEMRLPDFQPNCFTNNGDADYYDYDWCGGFENPISDISTVNCEYEALPGQTGIIEE